MTKEERAAYMRNYRADYLPKYRSKLRRARKAALTAGMTPLAAKCFRNEMDRHASYGTLRTK